MECWIQWATLASPIISVVAIIVALCVARSSSKDAQQQIKAIHNLLDVFVAANNLDIVEAQRKYQRQLIELDQQIEDAQLDVDTVYHLIAKLREWDIGTAWSVETIAKEGCSLALNHARNYNALAIDLHLDIEIGGVGVVQFRDIPQCK